MNKELLDRINEIEDTLVELAADVIRNSDKKEVVEKETVIKEKPIKGDPGEDGISLESIKVINNNILVKLSNGKEIFAGKIDVPNIDNPPFIKDVYSDADYRLIIEMSNGHIINGPVLPRGKPGEIIESKPPKIISAHVEDGDLIFNFDDKSVINAGKIPKSEKIIKMTGGGSSSAKAYVDERLRSRPYLIISDNYTTRENDYYIEIDTSGKTITLGDDGIIKGKEVHIDNSSDGDCYVTPIAGSTTITLHCNEGSYFVYNGTVWRIK